MSDSNVLDLRGDGRILLYPRGAKGTYQVRIRVPNSTGHVIKTTKTNRLHEATAFAVNLYDELYHHVKQGGSLKKGPTTQKVFAEWSKLEPRTKIVATVARYFVPYFATTSIEAISSLTDFWLDRTANPKARKPSPNTLKREVTYITILFRYALAKRYITTIPDLNPLDYKDKASRRDNFTSREWSKLTRNAREWVKEQGIATTRDRTLAVNYFMILANSGIRIGEARNLHWQDIRTTKDGHTIFTVHGKTGTRETVTQPNTATYLDRIRPLTGNQKLVFCHPDGSPIASFKTAFHALLTYAGIPKGNRSIYSLRHTYATFRLQHGVNPYMLAKNMGTSVEMLERHYGHLINAELARQLTKLDR